ncbi:hypothetical protein [Desulfoscipio geothermicus]|uniref:hypothetical protein n=1 Tax=Desulfoscipio geothermicus TaxID=39060 RepID=UPI000B89F085|nr:hypothetical protein [Desulfoscipio geothermicus]
MHKNELLVKELDAALDLCRSRGWKAEVEYTSPPRDAAQGKQRVIRCRRLADNKLVLTVAREVPGKEV